MSGLIWVQTVCNDYQQIKLVGKDLTLFMLDSFEASFQSNNDVARTRKSFAQQRETTGSSSDSLQLHPFS